MELEVNESQLGKIDRIECWLFAILYYIISGNKRPIYLPGDKPEQVRFGALGGGKKSVSSLP